MMQYDGIRSLTPREAYELNQQDDAMIVDLRETDYTAFKRFNVVDVVNFPLSVIKERHDRLPHNRLLILADSSGLRTREIALFLIKEGHKEVATMAGGFVEWERDRLPVSTDINQRLSGACACQLKPRERKKKKKN